MTRSTLVRLIAAIAILPSAAVAPREASAQALFGPPVTITAGQRVVALADMNGDGRADVVSVAQGMVLTISLSAGGGAFLPYAWKWLPGEVTALKVADMNGDRRLDVVTTFMTYPDCGVAVALGDGAGRVAEPTQVALPCHLPRDLAVGDLNTDGRADVVVANYSDQSVSLLLGGGGGGGGALGPPAKLEVGHCTSPGYCSHPIGVALGDVDGDGLIDVVTASQYTNDFSVRLGAGAGAFAASTVVAGLGNISYDGVHFAPHPASLVLADVNGDSHLDIVGGYSNSDRIAVLHGTGDGTFGAPAALTIGTCATVSGSWTCPDPVAVAVGDIDRDGRVDVVAAVRNRSAVAVFPQAATDGFDGARSSLIGFAPVMVAVGDIQGDGRLDVVAVTLVSPTSQAVALFGAPSEGELLRDEIELLRGEVDFLRRQLENLNSENGRLRDGLGEAQDRIDALTAAIAAGVGAVEALLRTTFNAPGFVIPGATPEARLQNLVEAIGRLNRGRLEGLFVALGGRR